MSSRLAFQTQLASIMEVLANAAVAEICKLVDDDYAVVSLQMSQCQKENKALKRKLHLLELKMARGAAERRLRESAFNSGRLRVQIGGSSDRFRDTSPSADGAFEQQSVSLWPNRALTASITEQSEHPQSKSPDVQFVEPEPVIVKEETKTETKEEEIHVIEDNGDMECSPHVAERLKHGLEIPPSTSSQVQTCTKTQTLTTARTQQRNSTTNRRVEDEGPDVVLVKVEEPEELKPKPNTPSLSIQEGLVESSTDDIKAVLPFIEASQISANQLQESTRGISELESSDALLQIPVSTQSATGSDFALFELEPFFTRWAPDRDSAAPPGAPSSANASAESGKNDVIVENNKKDRFMNATTGYTHLQPSVSQALSSVSPLSSIQIQAVHSQWVPALLQKPHLLQNVQTSQQTHTESNIPDSLQFPSTINASSSAASSSSAIPLRHTNQRHSSQKTGSKFICKTCGKAFPAWSNFEVHQRVHTGERPFKCDTCGKRFSEAGNLKKHQRVHTGEKPYSCDKCGKKFAWICNLKTHQQTATGCVQHQAWRALE
uniref:C2H2-type domain-containing protein n=1 Tax=Neogobius melanostomus TaxID=47308 RepID=A0A8C6TM68_9GOBI